MESILPRLVFYGVYTFGWLPAILILYGTRVKFLGAETPDIIETIYFYVSIFIGVTIGHFFLPVNEISLKTVLSFTGVVYILGIAAGIVFFVVMNFIDEEKMPCLRVEYGDFESLLPIPEVVIGIFQSFCLGLIVWGFGSLIYSLF